MPAGKHEITRDDVMPMDAYGKIRQARRGEIVARKRQRRLAVGPYATVHFENYDSMWLQVHEMLYIEKGGEAQIPDELAAYNPLIPNGRELVATILFEIDDKARRHAFLAQAGGVEETVFLKFDDEEIMSVPEADVDRTSANGKASSVQFVHFPFTDAQAAKFRAPGTEIVLGIKHPAYAHMTVLPEAVCAALSEDFD
jgi:hypothetical protein